ncbi:MAG: hypothetical protein JSS72_13065 [Armatimonadetes bacterium]|nr:hypothetical protein [Armatimonadota bacterium]
MGNGKWRIEIGSDLGVFSPDGQPCELPSRKVKSLLAFLALTPGHSASRSSIAANLWPSAKKDAARLSLRQTLHLCRPLGWPWLVMGRTELSLDTDAVELVGIEDTHGAGRTGALKELTEPFFERFRLAAFTPSQSGNFEDAAESLVAVLRWCVENRPRAALDTVRACTELVHAARPTAISEILNECLNKTPTSTPNYGWGLFHRGAARSVDIVSGGAEKDLRLAQELAIQHKDLALFVEASFYLAALQILRGSPDIAIKEMDRIYEITSKRGSMAQNTRLKHGQGLCLIHAGHFTKGLREMRTALASCDPVSTPYEYAYLAANLAWFESTCGKPESALKLVERVRTMPQHRHWRTRMTCLLAESAATHNSELCQEVLTSPFTGPSSGFRIYAWEIKAVLARNARSRADNLEKALEARKRGFLAITAWDRHRMKAFPEYR